MTRGLALVALAFGGLAAPAVAADDSRLLRSERLSPRLQELTLQV